MFLSLCKMPTYCEALIFFISIQHVAERSTVINEFASEFTILMNHIREKVGGYLCHTFCINAFTQCIVGHRGDAPFSLGVHTQISSPRHPAESSNHQPINSLSGAD